MQSYKPDSPVGVERATKRCRRLSSGGRYLFTSTRFKWKGASWNCQGVCGDRLQVQPWVSLLQCKGHCQGPGVEPRWRRTFLPGCNNLHRERLDKYYFFLLSLLELFSTEFRKRKPKISQHPFRERKTIYGAPKIWSQTNVTSVMRR